MTDQNDDGKNSKKRRRPSVTDGDSALKKGPWSADEDKILREYVGKYGPRNWNSVMECTGLRRNGPSCRLRWINQLKPDLKKGAITKDEGQRIADLHAQMGNKWNKIAAKLPGRADSKIKNYWNFREKQLKSRNVPLNLAGSQGCQNMGTVQPVRQWIPNADFGNLDMRAASMVNQGVSSPNSQSFCFPTSLISKNRPMESETKSAGEKIPEPISLCTQYDIDLSSTYDLPEPGAFRGRHVNLEFPSFQYSETQQDSWRMPSFRQPSIESAFDTSIQYPPVEQIQSKHHWPIDSELSLDTYHYEPNSEQSLQRPFVQHVPQASFSYTDAASRSFISSVQTEQNTPFLGRSASSLFNESSPISGGSSYDIGVFSSQDRASAQQPEAKATFEQMDTGHNVLSDSWFNRSFSLPSLESSDTSIQSPPVEQMQSEWSTNSGLLDSVLCGLNSGKCIQKSFVRKYPEASFPRTDAADGSSATPFQAIPNTPFGQSAPSSFSESTPISGTSSSYDPGCFFNNEAAVDPASMQQPEEKATSEQTDFSGTNVLPGPTKDKWRK